MQVLRNALSLRTVRQLHNVHPHLRRLVSTLPGSPHIYVFPQPSRNTSLLTLLPSEPPNPSLSIGETTSVPVTTESFNSNPQFMEIVHSVLATHASSDPAVQAQARAMASSGGDSFGSGVFPPHHQQQRSRRKVTAKETGAGGASAQGGMGSAGRGGFIHVADQRNPPDWGRVAWPEDIFGSLEVDGKGNFVDSAYQPSGTYRIITREGFFGLSPYLLDKVVERLKEAEEALG